MSSEQKPADLLLLKLDYEKTLAFIDKLDDFLFRIRNWGLVTCSGVLAFGLQQQSFRILGLNLLIAAGFLFVELIYKSFHEDALGKSFILEELIHNYVDGSELPSNYHFGIGHSIHPVGFGDMVRILFNRKRWHISAFYILLALATVIATLVIDTSSRTATEPGNPTSLEFDAEKSTTEVQTQ